MSRPALLFFALFISGCVTDYPPSPYANGVHYLPEITPDVENCEKVGSVVGRPQGVWGGKIGQSEARIDLVTRAPENKITHLVESDSSITTGQVTATGYRCDPQAPGSTPSTPLHASNKEPTAKPSYSVGARFGRANAVTAIGADFSFLRDDGNAWAITLLGGSSDSQAFGDDFEDADRTMSGSLRIVQYRMFFGPSFFASAGVGNRWVNYEAKFSTFGGGSATYEGSSSSTVLTTSVGNIWRWPSGFYIGADWFGLTVPLDGSSKSKSNMQPPFDEAKDEELFEAMTDLSAKSAKQVMNFAVLLNIGGSF